MTLNKFILPLLLPACLLISSCKKDKDSDSDTTKPVLTLNGLEQMAIDVNSSVSDPGATATDAEDGDLTSKISSDWNTQVKTDKKGDYTVTYSVSDKAGNKATKTRSVKVKINSARYFGEYTASYAVLGGGSSTSTAILSAGSDPEQLIASPFLGPGGFPLKINLSGVAGKDLSVDQTEAAGQTYKGSGIIDDSGNMFHLTIVQTYNSYSHTLIVVYTKK